MTDWIALPHDPHPMLQAGCSLLLEQAALVIELRPGLAVPTVALDHHSPTSAFSVLADPAIGISVLHRQGRTLRRHSLPGPLPDLSSGALITFAWDAPGRVWALSVTTPDCTPPHRATGPDPIALPAQDGWTLCQTTDHPMLHWCGLRRLRHTPTGTTLVGHGTRIATPQGDRPAHSLRPGDQLLCPDGPPLTLRALRSAELPHHGSLAPVILRAGHFPIRHDLLVAPQTVLRLQGEDVDYVFGRDHVLIAAQDFTDPRFALRHRIGRSTRMVGLVTDRPGLILTDGLALHTGPTPRTLRPYESAALMAASRGTPLRAA